MAKITMLLLLALTVAVVVAGCESPERGDREFIPGKGWTPVSNPSN